MQRLTSLADRLWSGRTSALLLLLLFVGLRLADPEWLVDARLRAFDLYQSLRPRSVASQPVVIVAIDDDSISSLGQWPWPRTTFADLVDRLTALGAAAIAIDVLFVEPDRTSPAAIAKSSRYLDDATRQALLRQPSNEEIFARAIRRSRVVLAQAGEPETPEYEAPSPSQSTFSFVGSDPRPHLISLPRLIRSLPILESAAAGHGLVSMEMRRDGIVRTSRWR